MPFQWMLAASAAASAVLAAACAVAVLTYLQNSSGRRKQLVAGPETKDIVFLFDGETLVDSTANARALLSATPGAGSDLSRLIGYLSDGFPSLPDRLHRLPKEGRFVTVSTTDTASPVAVHAEDLGGLTRVSLTAAQTADAAPDALWIDGLERELGVLRRILGKAPFLAWRENAKGHVIWANNAYLNEAELQLPPDKAITWPLPGLFTNAVSVDAAGGQRIYLKSADKGQRWYDLRTAPDDDGTILFALPADSTVRAEHALQDFMQTLTKTFAHLPTGLAIFDRQRKLQLFNPALVDLTSLEPEFLISRPRLFAFLDAMHDQNMIPEPKDYRTWRQKMTAMEEAAASGQYEELWSLPTGQTYRVLGRPYPNGALALMFEDISTETSRSRRHRADIELGQAVIDTLDDAVAVFAQSGILVMTNTAYATIWNHDPAVSLSDTGIAALVAHWRSLTDPTGFWAEVDTFLGTLGVKDECRGQVRMLTGQPLLCRFLALPGGAILVSFQSTAPDTQAKGPPSVSARNAD